MAPRGSVNDQAAARGHPNPLEWMWDNAAVVDKDWSHTYGYTRTQFSTSGMRVFVQHLNRDPNAKESLLLVAMITGDTQRIRACRGLFDRDERVLRHFEVYNYELPEAVLIPFFESCFWCKLLTQVISNSMLFHRLEQYLPYIDLMHLLRAAHKWRRHTVQWQQPYTLSTLARIVAAVEQPHGLMHIVFTCRVCGSVPYKHVMEWIGKPAARTKSAARRVVQRQ